VLRVELAAERTALANERTLLAYVRTSLAIFLTGIGLWKLVATPVMVVIGIGMLPVAMLVLAIGIARYFQVRNRIRGAARASVGVDDA
jgi:putative membrane protein